MTRLTPPTGSRRISPNKRHTDNDKQRHAEPDNQSKPNTDYNLMRKPLTMNVADGIAVVLLCLTTTALIILLANLVHEGRSVVSLWLLWIVAVVVLTAGAVWLHDKIVRDGERQPNTQQNQAASAETAPVAMPANSLGATGAEQIQSQGENAGVAGQQSGNSGVIIQSSPLELWFAGAVAAATVVLAIFGAYQLKSIGRQLEIADATVEQMRLENRPWLAASKPKVEVNFDEFKIVGQVPVKNCGNTPAWFTAGAATAMVVVARRNHDEDMKKFVGFAKKELRYDVLSPGQEINMHVAVNVDSLKILEPEKLEQVKSGIEKETVSIFLVLHIEYRDISKAPLFFTHCFVFNPKTKEFWAHNKYTDMN